MSAPMWNAAVPAGQYPEHSSPRIVRQGKTAPFRPSVSARIARQVERRVPPAQHVARRARRGVGQHLQHERLGVPERVAVVARSRQPLRRDRAQLGATARLQELEEREAQRLLQRGVALDLDVGGLPEVVEVLPLRAVQTSSQPVAFASASAAAACARSAGNERTLDHA